MQNILAIIDVIFFVRGASGSFNAAGYLLAVTLASWLSIASSAWLLAAIWENWIKSVDVGLGSSVFFFSLLHYFSFSLVFLVLFPVLFQLS